MANRLRDIKRRISSLRPISNAGKGGEAGSIDSEMQRLKEKLAHNEDEQKANDEKITATNKELAKLRETEAKIQKEIDAIGGTRLQRVKTDLETQRRVVDEKQKHMNDLMTRQVQAEKTQKKAERDIQRFEAELKRLEELLQKIKNDREQLITDAAQSLAHCDELKKKTETWPDEIQQLETEINGLKEESTALQKRQVVVEEELNKITEQLETVEATIEEINKEIEKLKNMPVGYAVFSSIFLILTCLYHIFIV